VFGFCWAAAGAAASSVPAECDAGHLHLGAPTPRIAARHYSLLNGQAEFALDPVQPSFVPIEPRRDPGELDMQA
jgi:hypothetical protein